ncbi:MAG: class I tRNA ligase family protein, partial [Candidatus Colwellbacteria bacterium]|nr:class I tRNA ligase family protein [Candidatus Colwellbacteria bacterium]
RFEKSYFHWIDALRPWCISRQIWFGHRIPVWYPSTSSGQAPSTDTGEIYVDIEPPKGGNWEQDSDTLDTWFSSALWTFSTLGWPLDYTRDKARKGSDLAQYHPTDVLETAYEILFFWVARMILMTTYLLGEVPFHTVYLHGLVRDEQGRKISKSLGNGIDPLEMINAYGADAVRMSLIIGAAPGNDSKISEDKIRGYRNFTTKIWNASRFVLMNYDAKLRPSGRHKPKYTAEDKRNLKKLGEIKEKTAKYIKDYKYHQAGELLYQYFWHTFADKIVEKSKGRLRSENKADREAAQEMLISILRECVKMLHPFMPFVTEEVWKKLPRPTSRDRKPGFLMITKW